MHLFILQIIATLFIGSIVALLSWLFPTKRKLEKNRKNKSLN